MDEDGSGVVFEMEWDRVRKERLAYHSSANYDDHDDNGETNAVNNSDSVNEYNIIAGTRHSHQIFSNVDTSNISASIWACLWPYITCEGSSKSEYTHLLLKALDAKSDTNQVELYLNHFVDRCEDLSKGDFYHSDVACNIVDQLLNLYLSTDRNLCESALRAVCSLARIERNIRAFSARGSYFRVIRAARVHSADRVLTEWALRSIRFYTLQSHRNHSMSINSININAKLVAADVCELVCSALAIHSSVSTASLVECSLRIICSLCSVSVPLPAATAVVAVAQERFAQANICSILVQHVLCRTADCNADVDASTSLSLSTSIDANTWVWSLRAIGALCNGSEKTTLIFRREHHLLTLLGNLMPANRRMFLENALLASSYCHCVGSLALPIPMPMVEYTCCFPSVSASLSVPGSTNADADMMCIENILSILNTYIRVNVNVNVDIVAADAHAEINFEGERNVVEEALRAIQRLGQQSAYYLQRIYELNGCAVIVMTIQQHLHSGEGGVGRSNPSSTITQKTMTISSAVEHRGKRDEDVLLQWGWYCVATLCNSPECLLAFCGSNLKILSILMLTLFNYAYDIDVCIFTIRAIGSLCRNESWSNALSETVTGKEMIGLLSYVLNVHMDTQGVVEECMYTIGYLCCYANAGMNRQNCCETNIPGLLVECLKRYSKPGIVVNVNVVTTTEKVKENEKDKGNDKDNISMTDLIRVVGQACWCLCQILTDAAFPAGYPIVARFLAFGVADALPIVVNSYYKHSAKITELGMQAITLLGSTGNAAATKRLSGGGAVTTAVLVLKEHETNTQIAAWALQAIERLGSSPSYYSFSESVTSICLRQLEISNRSENLTKLALIALTSSMKQEKHGRTRLSAAGCGAMVYTVSKYAKSEEFVLCFLSCLNSMITCISHGHVYIDNLGQAGVATALVEAFSYHRSSSSVIMSMCGVVSLLCSKDAIGNSGRFVKSGMCSALANVLRENTAANSLSNDNGNGKALNSPIISSLLVAMGALLCVGPSQEMHHQLAFAELSVPELVCDTLRMYIDSSFIVVTQCCRVISLLATKNAQNQELIHMWDGVMLSVHSLKLYITEENTVIQCLSAIAELCLDCPINTATAAEHNVCELVIKSLEKYKQNENAASICCRVIFAIKSGIETIRTSAADAILTCLVIHMSSPNVVQWACRAIGSLAFVPSIKEHIVGNRACETIVRALQTHMDKEGGFWGLMWQQPSVTVAASLSSASVICRCCDAIYELTRGYGDLEQENRLILVKCGAVEVIAQAMKNHSDVVLVAHSCLRTIVVLADGKYRRPFTRLMGKLGVCGAAVDALHSFPASVVVGKWGLRAVTILAEENPNNISWLIYAGVCEAIVEVVLANLSIIPIVCAGCDAITTIADEESSENAIRLGHAGCCEVVVSVLRMHAASADPAERACRAMANLARNKSNATWFGPSGACNALIVALRNHSTNESLVSSVWLAVGSICTESANRSRFASLGACSLVVETLHDLPTSKSIARSTGLTISRLAREGFSDSTVNRNCLLNAGVCKVCCHAMENHLKDSAAIFHLLRTVIVLASTTDFQVQLGSFGACELVVKALKLPLYELQEGICRCGCLALSALAKKNCINQKLFKSVGAFDSLSSSLKRHQKSAYVCDACLRAFAALTDGNDDQEFLSCFLLKEGVSICEILLHVIDVHCHISPTLTYFGAIVIRQLSHEKIFRVCFAACGSMEVLGVALEVYAEVVEHANVTDAILLAMNELLRDKGGQRHLSRLNKTVDLIICLLLQKTVFASNAAITSTLPLTLPSNAMAIATATSNVYTQANLLCTILFNLYHGDLNYPALNESENSELMTKKAAVEALLNVLQNAAIELAKIGDTIPVGYQMSSLSQAVTTTTTISNSNSNSHMIASSPLSVLVESSMLALAALLQHHESHYLISSHCYVSAAESLVFVAGFPYLAPSTRNLSMFILETLHM